MLKNSKKKKKKEKKKQKHDKNRKDVHFQAGDKKWIKVHSQNSAEKDFIATLAPNQRFLTELFK